MGWVVLGRVKTNQWKRGIVSMRSWVTDTSLRFMSNFHCCYCDKVKDLYTFGGRFHITLYKLCRQPGIFKNCRKFKCIFQCGIWLVSLQSVPQGILPWSNDVGCTFKQQSQKAAMHVMRRSNQVSFPLLFQNFGVFIYYLYMRFLSSNQENNVCFCFASKGQMMDYCFWNCIYCHRESVWII